MNDWTCAEITFWVSVDRAGSSAARTSMRSERIASWTRSPALGRSHVDALRADRQLDAVAGPRRAVRHRGADDRPARREPGAGAAVADILDHGRQERRLPDEVGHEAGGRTLVDLVRRRVLEQ